MKVGHIQCCLAAVSAAWRSKRKKNENRLYYEPMIFFYTFIDLNGTLGLEKDIKGCEGITNARLEAEMVFQDFIIRLTFSFLESCDECQNCM